MAAKNKRPAIPDIQGDFAAHVEANRRAHEWAAKCIVHREAGKTAQAKAAEQNARRGFARCCCWKLGQPRQAFWRAQNRGLGGRKASARHITIKQCRTRVCNNLLRMISRDPME
jgi:hypothetical protein